MLILRALLVVTAVSIGLGAAGCKSKAERAEKHARQSASDFRSDLGRLPGQIDRTMSELRSIEDATNPDRTRSLERYQYELERTRHLANNLGSKAAEARTDTEKFYRAWTKETMRGSPESRDAALNAIEQRKTTNFETATGYIERGSQAMRGLMTQLDTINNALSKSLDQSSINAVSENISRAIQESERTKALVARLGEQIDSALAK